MTSYGDTIGYEYDENDHDLGHRKRTEACLQDDDEQRNWNLCSSKMRRPGAVLLLAVLYAMRFICCFTNGYIHPDEFYQGGQELFFDATQTVIRGGNATTMNETKVITIIRHGAFTTTATIGDNSINKNTPCAWEWETQNALRSIFVPWFMTKLPLQFYTFFIHYFVRTSITTLSGIEILIVPRLWLCLLSFLTLDIPILHLLLQRSRQQAQAEQDYLITRQSVRHTSATSLASVEKISTEKRNVDQQPFMIVLCIFASSWTILLFCTRPFSNTLETMFLSVLIWIVFGNAVTNNEFVFLPNMAVGSIAAFGFFTRFTFVFFSVPIILYHLFFFQQVDSNKNHGDNGNKGEPESTTSPKQENDNKHTNRMIHVILWNTLNVTIGFLIVSIIIVFHDTCFYNKLNPMDMLQRMIFDIQQMIRDVLLSNDATTGEWRLPKPVLTPYNFFMYNINTENVSSHGLHPRWTHALVNMFLMFGPLAVIFYTKTLLRFKSVLFTRTDNDSTIVSSTSTNKERSNNHNLHHVMDITIILGLLCLSLSPHQEPRFILPLTVPLTITTYPLMVRNREKLYLFLIAWIIFNVVLFYIFGCLHQSGVVPILLHLGKELDSYSKSPTTHIPQGILFFKTYMPPSFLLRHVSTKTVWDDVVSSNSNHIISPQECTINKDMQKAEEDHFPYFIDIKGDRQEDLMNEISQMLQCYDETNDNDNNGGVDTNPQNIERQRNGKQYLIVVAPPDSVSQLCAQQQQEREGLLVPVPTFYQCRDMFHVTPHLRTEDIGDHLKTNSKSFLSSLSLVTTNISCT